MTILHVAVYMTDLKVPQGVDGTREDSRLSGHYSDVDDRDIKAGLQRHDIWREKKTHCPFKICRHVVNFAFTGSK